MVALRGGAGRGKSGLHGGAVPGNPRRGRPQGKCHRKDTAGSPRLAGRAARVKWCGKSAPRRRQRRRQGKPHREQDQVGAAGGPEQSGAPGRPPRRRSGRSHQALGDERRRGMAIPAPGGCIGGGTEPGLHAVWRRPRGGRFSGSNRDKCGFWGTTVWIAESAVACLRRPHSVAVVAEAHVSRP